MLSFLRQSCTQRRRLAAALAILVATQFLLGFGLHVHTLADCDTPNAVHSDVHAHPDQVELAPDGLTGVVGHDIDLPVLLLVAILRWPFLFPALRRRRPAAAARRERADSSLAR